MGTMYDAVDVAAIPADAEIVAGYVDGNFPTYGPLVAAFPNAQHVSIATSPNAASTGAMVADCENGDFTPQTAAQWAKQELDAGRRPTIYYAKATAPAVSSALAAAGVVPSQVDFWVADWTGQAHLVPGSVATQWASPTSGSGGNFDISETSESWPSVPAPDPAPLPPSPGPAPSTTESEAPVVQYEAGGQTHVFVYEADKNRTVHYWQALPGSGGASPDPSFYDWHSEALPEPA